MKSTDVDYGLYMKDIALQLLGKPIKESKNELRFGKNRGSLSVDLIKGAWHDHATDEKGGVLDLIIHETDCSDRGEAHAWGVEQGYWTNGKDKGNSPGLGTIVATFDYRDEKGVLLFQVVKYDPKDYRQRRPDGKGDWINDIKGVRRVPYCLPRLLKDVSEQKIIYICEGEKDCDNLHALGLAATTNAMGAKKWHDKLSPFLLGADVVVIADNDEAGKEHVEIIAAKLTGTAKRIRVLDLEKVWPACPENGDISDWLEAGHEAEELGDIIAGLPDWREQQALEGTDVSANDHWERAAKMRSLLWPHLVHYRDDFMDWVGGAYRIVDDLVINADTWRFLNGAITVRGVGKKRKRVQFQPCRNSVGETLAALKAVAILDPGAAAPTWTNGRKDLPPEDIIAFPNGLLDLRDNKLHPLDPAFFTTASLGFDYVAEAPEPKNWLVFLEQIYEGDDSAAEIAQVQEMFGYMLTGDTSQEKAFFFLGPKRSGKGTMARMLQHLLAPSAVAGPTLKSLDANFGLAPLIDKQLAIIDDLRVGPSTKEQGSMVENILKITGRGLFTLDRKFKTAWTGTLPVKLLVISNPLPKWIDESGVLASRIVTSNTKQSFYGKEDPLLFKNKLLPELLGIFHWSLDGLRRLRERGYFNETEGSKETRERLAQLGSPVMGFITERCELHPNKRIRKSTIFQAWCEYSIETKAPVMSQENFFEALYAATGGQVRGGKHREHGKPVPYVLGIDIQGTAPTQTEMEHF